MVETPALEELASLRQALADALKHNESLAGELRVTRTERDLLKEQLNKFKRQLFAASSEVTGEHQKDLFFNEAESLGAQVEPAAEEAAADTVDVPGHKRAKRGRKPLDPALPREVVRHELPEAEQVCPHDGSVLREIGVEVSEQLDINDDDVASIIGQLLEALDHAHVQGVWHRDIKPSNLIITPSGKVKVSDFGIARIENADLTQAASLIGTPAREAR